MRKVIFTALVLVIGSSAFVQLGPLCMVCSDVDDSTCSDTYYYMSEHVTGCDYNDRGCSKQKIEVKFSGIAFKTITRTCGSTYDNDNCKRPSSFDVFDIKSRIWECSCFKDFCNSGNLLAVSSALIMSALAQLML